MFNVRLGNTVLTLGMVLGLAYPGAVRAGRVVDQDLSVSFTPPPYFQATRQPEGKPIHFVLVPPDRTVTISTGAQFDRKLRNVPPMRPDEVKALCTRAAALVGKGLILKQSKRFLLDSQNGAECQFAGVGGRTVHWIGAPVPAELVLFIADWPRVPTREQVTVFRQFLGGVQIF